jgi:hypothetical protein
LLNGKETPVADSPLRQALARPLGIVLLAAATLVPVAGVVAAVGLGSGIPAVASATDQGKLRLVLAHTGQIKEASTGLTSGQRSRLPEGVTAAQVLGGERFPVQIRFQIAGQPPMEREYRPAGLRREGPSRGFEEWTVSPGQHQVDIHLMDDGATWRPVFSGLVTVEPGQVRTLTFDTVKDATNLR